MPLLTPSAVHVDRPLTNLAILNMQQQQDFIADKVFPNVPSQYQSDEYYIWKREDFLRDEMKLLSPGTSPERIGLAVETGTFSIKVRGLSAILDNQTAANEDQAIRVREAHVMALTQKGLINRDRNWVSTYFATNVWDTEYDGVASADNNLDSEITQWDDYSNSNPVIDVTNAKTAMSLKAGGLRPNVMVVTQDVHDVLVNHPVIIERISGGATTSSPAMVSRQFLASVFEVEEYLVINTVFNNALEGATENLEFIASKKAALYHRPQSPGIFVPSAGYNFTWSTLDNSSGYGVEIMSYSDDALKRQHIAEELQLVMAYDQKLVSAELGVFFNTVIS